MHFGQVSLKGVGTVKPLATSVAFVIGIQHSLVNFANVPLQGRCSPRREFATCHLTAVPQGVDMRLSVFVEIGLRLGRVDTVDFGTSERARLAVTVGHVTAEGVGAGKAPCSAVSVVRTVRTNIFRAVVAHVVSQHPFGG